MGVLERRIGNVLIDDVSKLLPRHSVKRYRPRAEPSEVYVHHSGKLGKRGYQGLYNSARYVVRYRHWPGMPYHFWIPYHSVSEDDGLVVYRAQPSHLRTYHAGRGPNRRGIAICLQGNTTTRPASTFQLECLGTLIEWLGLPVRGHCEAPPDGHAKLSCPGTHAMSYLVGFRRHG